MPAALNIAGYKECEVKPGIVLTSLKINPLDELKKSTLAKTSHSSMLAILRPNLFTCCCTSLEILLAGT